MNAVELHGVTLAIGGRTVLDQVSLAVGDGEFVGVLGPNGAGKTTLFRAILGLLRVTQGTIQVLGRPAARGAPVGYMPQVRAGRAGPLLSGRSFVAGALHGARWGLPWLSPADRAEVVRVLDLVDAGMLAERPLMSLSGGERQRLLLAQALLGRPRLLLLDEPLMSLDPAHVGAVVDLVRQVQRRLGITVLFSAHELNPLLGALDRVLYLGSGQAAIGTVEDVITGPVLSRLYGSPIDVLHADGRVFVMSGRHRADHGCLEGHAAHV